MSAIDDMVRALYDRAGIDVRRDADARDTVDAIEGFDLSPGDDAHDLIWDACKADSVEDVMSVVQDYIGYRCADGRGCDPNDLPEFGHGPREACSTCRDMVVADCDDDGGRFDHVRLVG